jgi:hypothetical protein
MSDKNLILNVSLKGGEDVNKLNQEIDKVTQTTKKGANEYTRYRREIQLAKADMLKFAEGTEEYNRAVVKASQMQMKWKENMDIVRASTRDFGESAKILGGAIGGVAGGFQVAASVMGLFGTQSESAQKAIQGIVGAMAITEGILRFADTFDSIQDIIAGFKATSAIESIGGLDKALEKSSDSSLVHAANLGANVTQMAKFDEASKVTSTQIEKLGESFTKLDTTNTLKDRFPEFGDELDDIADYKKELNSVQNELAKNQELERQLNTERTDASATLETLTKGTKEYSEQQAVIKDLTERHTKASEKFGKLQEKETELVGNLIDAKGELLEIDAEQVKELTTLNNSYKDNINLTGDSKQTFEEYVLSLDNGKEAVENLGIASEDLNDVRTALFETDVKSTTALGKVMDKQKEQLKVTNESTDSTKKLDNATKSATDSTKKLDNATKGATDSTNKLDGSTKKAAASLGRSALMMGGVLAIIGAITYGVTKLIEWLNKIPTDLQVKITLAESVTERMTSIRTDLAKIANDFAKATKDGDDAMKKKVIDYAKEKYNITEASLNQLGEMGKNWEDVLSQTLVGEKQVEYQRELIESIQKQQTEYDKLIVKEREYNQEADKVLQKRTEAAKAGEGVFKFDIQLSKLFIQKEKFQKEMKKAKEQLDAMKKLVDEDTYVLEFKDEKGGGSSKIKQTYYNLKEWVGDYVGFRIKQGELLKKKEFEWTQAEAVNMTELQKKRNEIIQKRIAEGGGFMNKRFFTGNRESELEALKLDAELLFAGLKDINNEIDATKQKIAESAGKLNPETRAKAEQEYNSLIDKQNLNLTEKQSIEFKLAELQQQKIAKEREYNELVKTANTSEDKSVASNAANKVKAVGKEISSLNSQMDEQSAVLDRVNTHIDKYNTAITEQEAYIATLEKGSQEYETAVKDLMVLEGERDTQNEAILENEREQWNKRIEVVKQYAQAISDIFAGISNIYQGEMDTTNAKFNEEKWHIEESMASNEEREQLLYELEMRRYEALIQDFENNKKAKEAQAWVDMLGGIVSIWSMPVTAVLSPVSAILKGLESAALMATTVGSVRQIRAQRLEKPHAPRSSGGSKASTASALALNPRTNNLTTSEDRINISRQASKANELQATVKVSDINKVQNTVSVRDSKTTY